MPVAGEEDEGATEELGEEEIAVDDVDDGDGTEAEQSGQLEENEE